MKPLPHFDEILQAVETLPPISVAVVDSEERHVLEGVFNATQAEVFTPILLRSPWLNIPDGRPCGGSALEILMRK